ncbi:hypothetical protein [Autumnicola musiva]|uniref:PepSY domain-containing protein n=1 Tax=Autumnicola musiva TaxID=3075589 RepID=A0ABU3D7P2_9FLAO|nr:hypothetical protein [Zunongwangia sp. F117]MDT0677543.1 hypothetical protein [Zunongwangia sp. F117]
MKKLVLTFAAVGLMFTTTTQAQAVAGAESQISTEVVAGDEFEKIEVSALPSAVTTAIETDYAEATIQEAWVKEKEDKKVYKIKLTVNGEEKKVYADAEGNWIDVKEKKEDKNS